MELQVNPSTPQEVMEERRKESIEDAMKIEEETTLCAKVVEQVSQSWESLINNE